MAYSNISTDISYFIFSFLLSLLLSDFSSSSLFSFPSCSSSSSSSYSSPWFIGGGVQFTHIPLLTTPPTPPPPPHHWALVSRHGRSSSWASDCCRSGDNRRSGQHFHILKVQGHFSRLSTLDLWKSKAQAEGLGLGILILCLWLNGLKTSSFLFIYL